MLFCYMVFSALGMGLVQVRHCFVHLGTCFQAYHKHIKPTMSHTVPLSGIGFFIKWP
jgi:hypothetical protein